jgi:hypothetical protein
MMAKVIRDRGRERTRIFVVAALSVGVVALAPLGAAEASVSAHHEALRASAKGLGYYNLHPCALITRAEVASIYGAPMGAGEASPNAYGGSCSYSTTSLESKDVDKSLSYAFDSGTAASASSYFKGPHTREPSVGHNAYCAKSSSSIVELEADAGNANGTPYHLNMATDSCADGVKLAKVAFSHLS